MKKKKIFKLNRIFHKFCFVPYKHLDNGIACVIQNIVFYKFF